MENIIIIDNFLNDYELELCLDIVNKKSWKYGHTSGNYEKINNSFFAAYDMDDFFNTHIKQKIEEKFSKNFTLDRNYMHVQLYGQDGSYHIDTDKPYTYTFCIYITDISNSNITHSDGDFVLKVPNSNRIISIETQMNRGIFFPSTYIHKGMAYNRFYKEKRLCITWKLTENI